jgi:dynein heavy chain
VIEIDKLSFDYFVKDDMKVEQITQKPPDGCYIYGLFLEGCKWSDTEHELADSDAKKLFVEMPIMFLVPVMNRKTPETGVYYCPLYKVLSRSGTLSTTGHSTNFVMVIELPSKEEQRVWIKAGVAAFLALRY